MEASRAQFWYNEGTGFESRGKERAAGEVAKSTEGLVSDGKSGWAMFSYTCQLQRVNI